MAAITITVFIQQRDRSGEASPHLKDVLELEDNVRFAQGLPLNTAISEKTGPLEICLKNVLENFKVYWSQITEDLTCQEEKFRLHSIGN